MAVCTASKHAIEGYSESLDHEIREHGIRSILAQHAYTRTGFEANSTKPDIPLHAYAKQRQTVDRGLAEATRNGDAPAVVAKAIGRPAKTVRWALANHPRRREPAAAWVAEWSGAEQGRRG